MNPSDTTLNQLLLNRTVLGVQAATAFSQAQVRLGLQHVLDADRMTSPQGLAQSRDAVQQLLPLMAQYKAVHTQLITGATSQWVAAVEGMPEESRAALQQHFTQAINRNLQDQARLYDCRADLTGCWPSSPAGLILAVGLFFSLTDQSPCTAPPTSKKPRPRP